MLVGNFVKSIVIFKAVDSFENASLDAKIVIVTGAITYMNSTSLIDLSKVRIEDPLLICNVKQFWQKLCILKFNSDIISKITGYTFEMMGGERFMEHDMSLERIFQFSMILPDDALIRVVGI